MADKQCNWEQKKWCCTGNTTILDDLFADKTTLKKRHWYRHSREYRSQRKGQSIASDVCKSHNKSRIVWIYTKRRKLMKAEDEPGYTDECTNTRTQHK